MDVIIGMVRPHCPIQWIVLCSFNSLFIFDGNGTRFTSIETDPLGVLGTKEREAKPQNNYGVSPVTERNLRHANFSDNCSIMFCGGPGPILCSVTARQQRARVLPFTSLTFTTGARMSHPFKGSLGLLHQPCSIASTMGQLLKRKI